MSEILNANFILNLLMATIRIATQLLLVAIGELYSERAGMCNIGLDGLMSIGGFIPGNVPIIFPSNITTITSASLIISSRLALINKIPQPRFFSCSICSWTNSDAPISSPLVGCIAIKKSGLLCSSLARITFCWFPPDRLRTA